MTPKPSQKKHPEDLGAKVARLEKELAQTRLELAGAKKLCDHLSRLIREVEEHAERESLRDYE